MEQLSLFDHREHTAPLASRLRPDNLEEYVGQRHLVGRGKILRQLIEKDQVSSMIFWGPPGVGKTTLGPSLFCNDTCESCLAHAGRAPENHGGDLILLDQLA